MVEDFDAKLYANGIPQELRNTNTVVCKIEIINIARGKFEQGTMEAEMSVTNSAVGNHGGCGGVNGQLALRGGGIGAQLALHGCRG